MAIALLARAAIPLAAQSRWQISPQAFGILVADRSDPVPGGGALTEVRVVQPLLMLNGSSPAGKIGFTATVDLEGVTIKSGELTPGTWGEGFVDRRHPHTTVHELNASINDILGALDGNGRLSIVAGKGFAPFGSDDPMARPFERYPVNHHLAQILERAIGIVQYAAGPVTLEGALFNGDEPTRPSDWPVIRTDGKWRFGDSRSARVTVRAWRGLEVQGSLAHVHSPESRPGAGPDANKVSVSARWDDRTVHGERYALVEWARTSELGGFFVFRTFLGEGMVTRGRWRVSYRFESTDRPEELRLVDQFRTQRPSPDNSILGITRWSLHTLHIAWDVVNPGNHLEVQPFVEGTLGHVSKLDEGIFDPKTFYGTDQVRALNIGIAAGWGMRGHRMGRYGAAAEPMAAMSGMKM